MNNHRYSILLLLYLVFDAFLSQNSFADCTGCCSGHGGVVCSGGVTKCGDGTPLSDSCVAKKCSVFLSPPGKAILISPSGFISTTTPAYSWNAVSGATWYLLWVNDAAGSGVINTWYSAEQANCVSGTGACSAKPSTPLATGAAQWWIQTWSEAGYGPWSDGMNFSVNAGGPPQKASLISPSGNILTSTPKYTWNAVESSTWYFLYVNDSKTRAIINKWYKASDAKCDSGYGTCSVTPDVALAPGACQWWIQTWNNSGYGPWSDGMAFVIGSGPPGRATLISPSGTITTAMPTYSWNAVIGATWYLLWVNDNVTSGKINKWYTAEQAGCASGTGDCSVKPVTSLANGTAQWWIQTYNDSGNGPWSEGMGFAVASGITGPYGIEFVTVAAGEFLMGSTSGPDDEQPVHRVIISKSFQLGKYEITQAQWKAVMGINQSCFTGDENLPVERVSWDEVQAFIAKLNARSDGYRYRLPTEAEWEYACRAGTTGDYGAAGNLDEMAWYGNNSGNKTHVVGTRRSNAWGLYDMHGNVWEWVQDWYGKYASGTMTDPMGPSSGSDRAVRGGGWGDDAGTCRSAIREYFWPAGVSGDLGFRLLRTVR